MTEKADGNGQPQDNYADFIGRLDSAAVKLNSRRDSDGKTLRIAQALHDQNNHGMQMWAARLAAVDRQLKELSGTAASAKSLMDLHDVAQKMEAMFRNRTWLAWERLKVIGERWNKVNQSLEELQQSRDKLTSSRMLAEERQKLGKALRDLAGAAHTGMGVNVSDPELRDDLKHAHEAVTMAEALLELKAR